MSSKENELMKFDKNKRIEAEIKKFKKTFQHLPDNKKIFAERLYRQAAFMTVTLEELKEKIKEEGTIIKAVNGNGFEVMSEHPAQKSYNITIKNYNATIKLLIELNNDNEEDEDSLIKFLKRDDK